jgi:predicted nucleic acid-binding protein
MEKFDFSVPGFKCYNKKIILEYGSDIVSDVYTKALNGDLRIAFSIWNIGEVLGALNKYYRRGWLSKDDYENARVQFSNGRP